MTARSLNSAKIIEAADALLDEIHVKACRVRSLAEAIETLCDREVGELGVNDLSTIRELARIIAETAEPIIAMTDRPAPMLGWLRKTEREARS